MVTNEIQGLLPYTHEDIDWMYYEIARNFQRGYPHKTTFIVPTRHGESKEFDQPVSFTIPQFHKYFVTNPGRVINLPFALAELIWIMSGSNKPWITMYNKQMNEYMDKSSEGVRKFNAAYGHRIREQFSLDQLHDTVNGFQTDMDSRQNVIIMRDPILDRSSRVTRDRACNIALMFLVRNNELQMSRVCRSQDFMWGIPYNWIQFGHIQQTIAEALAIEVGENTSMVQSLHLYQNHYEDVEKIRWSNWGIIRDFTVPELGDAVNIYLNHRHLPKTKWLDSVEEFALDRPFGKKDIDILVGDSPFWYNGLLVLLSYHRKYNPDWALETLDDVESELFRLMALRYYHRYWKGMRDAIETSNAYNDSEIRFIRS